MKAIVAVSQSWGIGSMGGMLFRLPGDLAFFRAATIGRVVVMGRKTLASFKGGKPLPDRTNIVLTRDESFAPDGVTVCHTLAQLQTALAAYLPEDIFVAGGGEVYRLLLPYCTEALVTKVAADAPADSFFPDLDALPGWRLAKALPPQTDNGHTIRFCTYQNEAPLSFAAACFA